MSITLLLLGFAAGWFMMDFRRILLNQPLLYSKWVTYYGLWGCLFGLALAT